MSPPGDETPAVPGVHVNLPLEASIGNGDPVVSEEAVEIAFSELANRAQASALPLPLPNPPLLPLRSLDPEMLERVVAEIVFRRRDQRGVHFYGSPNPSVGA